MPVKVIKGVWIGCKKKKEGTNNFLKRVTGGGREGEKDLREIHASQ